MQTTSIPLNSPADAFESSVRQKSRLWLPLVCGWLLMLFTVGHPSDDSLAPLVSPRLLTNTKLVLRLTVLAIMAVSLCGLWNHPRRRAVISRLLPLWMFALWAVTSAAWSPLKQITLGQSLGLLVLSSLASVIAIRWDGQQATSTVLHWMTLGAGSCSVVLILLHVLMPHVGAMTRDQGGLLHATNASATASLGLVIIVAARLLWGWRWTRQLLVPAIIVHVAVLLISANRLAAALALGMTPLLILVFSNRTAVIAAAVGCSILAAGYLAVDPGLELVDGYFGVATSFVQRDQSAEELSNLSGRREMWEAMWVSFAESPWIGHGYFVTSRTGEMYVWYEWGNWTAHSLYLQLLVTTGIIGTAIFAWGVLRLARTLIGGQRRGQISWRTTVFLAITSGWFFCWGLLNESIAGPLQPESVVFFALVGIAAGVATSSTAPASKIGVTATEQNCSHELTASGGETP